MARSLTSVVLLVLCASCVTDRVAVERGTLGPASYEILLEVSGNPALGGGETQAVLDVAQTADGAELELSVGDEDPFVIALERDQSGRLQLDSVEGVAPGPAGEADLASLVGQLDPPLPSRPVRLGDTWSSRRNLSTDTLTARLRSRFRLAGFRRAHGMDAVELRGRVSGRLETSGDVTGTVRGTTTILWAVRPGRLAASDTRLVWSIEGAGDVVLRTRVRPA